MVAFGVCGVYGVTGMSGRFFYIPDARALLLRLVGAILGANQVARVPLCWLLKRDY